MEVMGGRSEARQGCRMRLLSPGGNRGVRVWSLEVVMVTVFVLLLAIQGALTANVPLPKGECRTAVFCLSVCLYLSLCVSLSLTLSLSVCLSVCLSVSLSLSLSVCLCLCLSVCLSLSV